MRLVDELLDQLESEPELVFTLDGQLATVDDYLEVRPENEALIRSLVAEGRLAVGPWQILMDEFLVSGETIVRNLQRGVERAGDFGAPMRVGYLPDMFGHVAQMPQILCRAGIDVAVVWRGVPAAIDRHVFTWEAPDGSSLRTEFLPTGYGNAAYVLENPERLGEELAALDEAMRPFFGDDPLLAMVGTDHMESPPDLVASVRRTNEARDGHELVLSTLEGYLRRPGGTAGDPKTWRGEMRSPAQSNLLPGVVSARIDIKAACARAERLLSRYAEPLQALHGAAWPEAELALAWGRVIENSAHDSICGCSADPVSAQVLVRFDEAEQIASGLAAEAARAAAAQAPGGSVVVLNPSPSRRAGLVELDVLVPVEWDEVALELPDGSRVGTQEAGRDEPLLYRTELLGSEVPTIFRRLHGRELFGRRLNGFSVDV
ncbi:MAG: 2-O-(6-phospho-alpha-D-mannosyl)-D-glycerate hydrolase, partial [Gaiellaceae bacterium]|nr:2-O-(6-phospho-alpha-D-mannosyl)-D-glycerate hydrolase [Gaiellaceae bacterium]